MKFSFDAKVTVKYQDAWPLPLQNRAGNIFTDAQRRWVVPSSDSSRHTGDVRCPLQQQQEQWQRANTVKDGRRREATKLEE